MTMTSHKSKPGFTLLELILYTGLAAFILTAVTFFSGTILASQIKNQTIAEVEQQGIQIMQIMSQSLRNAQRINSPVRGSQSATLSIDGLLPAKNPTIFTLAGNAITMTEGMNPAIQLTSQRISASNLVFRNLSRNGTPGSVRIEFTLSRNNTEGMNEYEYAKTFVISVSLR
jgi:type II secretory pathway pseudopilin PulG